MAELPDEVMTDILTRLPVKSLLRFRCVSKPFRDLIDGPYFIKRHLNRSLETKTNHKLILQHSCLFSVDLDTLDYTLKLNHPLLSDQFSTQILGSVNGLFCLYNGQVDIVIWNLATRNYQKLHVPEIGFPGPRYCHHIVYGFGYDSVSDDYKLVRLVQFYGKDSNSFDSEAKVYNLRSNSWQRIKDFPYYLCYKRGYGKLACGALHWIVSSDHESDGANMIAAFDLSTNE